MKHKAFGFTLTLQKFYARKFAHALNSKNSLFLYVIFDQT
jgi:hypothetical protein